MGKSQPVKKYLLSTYYIPDTEHWGLKKNLSSQGVYALGEIICKLHTNKLRAIYIGDNQQKEDPTTKGDWERLLPDAQSITRTVVEVLPAV